MNTIDEIVKRISVANAESKRINEERNINIGKKETLTKQLNSAIEKYKQDYGVDITVDTLDAEVSRVIASKEAEVKNIETILSLIQEGRYVDAENIVNGVSTDSQAPEIDRGSLADIANIVADTTPISEPTPVTPVATVEPTPVEPASPVAEPTPVAPSAPTSPASPSAPVTPPPVNTSGIAALNGFSAPQQEAPAPAPASLPFDEPAPASPSSPSSPTSPNVQNVTSFSAILGGSSFQV